MSKQLETYLARIERRLWPMPLTLRREMVGELRGHLNEAVHDSLRAGHAPEVALKGTLQQFGEPEKIGRALRREWRGSKRQSVPPSRGDRLVLAWNVLFAGWFFLALNIGVAVVIRGACALFFAVSGNANTRFLERQDESLGISVAMWIALGLLLVFFGKLSNARRRGAA